MASTDWKGHMFVQEEQADELVCPVVRRKGRQDGVRDISDVINASEASFPLIVKCVRYVDTHAVSEALSSTHREQAI